MRHIVITAAAAALLSGCAQPVWYKPGATRSGFEVDKADCLSQAYGQVPYAPATTIEPGYASCTQYSCFSVGGGPVSYDANAGARLDVAKGCLYGKGYELVTRKQAEAMRAAASAPPPAPSVAATSVPTTATPQVIPTAAPGPGPNTMPAPALPPVPPAFYQPEGESEPEHSVH
jgi:hypothetical protein